MSDLMEKAFNILSLRMMSEVGHGSTHLLFTATQEAEFGRIKV
jgi:hypothetical protein